MEFTLIGKADWEQVYKDMPYGKQTCGDCRVAIAGTQRKHTLKEVVRWGEEPCYNKKHLRPFRITYSKRNCDACWDEFRKEAGRTSEG